MQLMLGVLDVSYSDASGSGTDTTYAVAVKLEERYAPMQTFFNSRKQKIADWLAQDMAHSLERIVQGKGIASSKGASFSNKFHKIADENYERSSLTYGADQKIEREFRQFLASNEMGLHADAQGLGGTASAKAGVSHRFKDVMNAKKKRGSRPFLIDTGLYSSVFRAYTTSDGKT